MTDNKDRRVKWSKFEALTMDDGRDIPNDNNGGGGVGMESRRTCIQRCCNIKTVKKRLPILKWAPQYNLKWAQCDFIAGLTVGLTVIPQGLAYASVAQLPLQYGLYSAFMGCFVYFFMGTSKDVTLGPTAIMSLMVGQYCYSEIPELRGSYAVLLSLMCGLTQVLMGVLNLGFVVSFLSLPVVSGFTSAAAIIIGFGQVKKVLGVSVHKHEGHVAAFVFDVIGTCKEIPKTRWQDLVLGLVCIAILFAMKRLKDIKLFTNQQPTVLTRIVKKILWLLGTARNAVIVIIGGALAYGLYAAGKEPFTLTGEVKPGLPSFELPKFSFEYGNTTVTAGEIFSQLSSGLAVVPLIGMLESIVIAKAFARKNQYKIDPTQELLAIGTANIVGSFVSAYPVTGSFSRTAVNSQSSVKTPAGGVITGVLVLLALSLLSATFKFIPQATLAAVIICAVASMFEYEIVPHLWKTKKIDIIPLALTFFACLFIGIEYGILAGVGISIIFLLYHMARPDLTIVSADMFLGENTGLAKADAANHNMHVSRVSDSIVIQPGISLYFPSTTYLIDTVSKCSTREDIPNPVIFDCTHISGTDFTTVQGFKQIVEEFESRNQPIIFCCMLAPILSTVESAHIKGFRHCNTVVEAYNIMAGQLSLLKDNTSRAALLHNSDTQNTMVSTASGDFDDRVENINSPSGKVHWDIQGNLDNDVSYLPFARESHK